MKKKGFTLVELLAVIAILAILIIIALPNIMALFNDAKKNSFTNELKELHKTALNQWMSDSMIDTKMICYSSEDVECETGVDAKELKLSGRTQLRYGITVDKNGEVIDFVATDDTYMYQFQGSTTPDGVFLKIEDLGSATASAVDTANAIARIADYGKTTVTITCDDYDFSISAS